MGRLSFVSLIRGLALIPEKLIESLSLFIVDLILPKVRASVSLW